MAKILAVATHATDDPTQCTLAFITAIGALGAGKEVTIALVGEGVYAAKEVIAKTIHGIGFPPLPELIEKVVKGKVPVYVWGACSVARGVTQEDLKSLNASFTDPIKFATMVSESSVVSFWCGDDPEEAAAEWGRPAPHTKATALSRRGEGGRVRSRAARALARKWPAATQAKFGDPTAGPAGCTGAVASLSPSSVKKWRQDGTGAGTRT